MAETVTLEIGGGNSHRLLSLGPQADALTGNSWELFGCPVCGYLVKMQFDPFEIHIARLGDGMISRQEAAEFAILDKTPAGRVQVEKRLAEAPAHGYVRVPSFHDLREFAQREGRTEEFDRAIAEAVADGKPIFRFGIDGHDASVYPPGVGRGIERSRTRMN